MNEFLDTPEALSKRIAEVYVGSQRKNDADLKDNKQDISDTVAKIAALFTGVDSLGGTSVDELRGSFTKGKPAEGEAVATPEIATGIQKVFLNLVKTGSDSDVQEESVKSYFAEHPESVSQIFESDVAKAHLQEVLIRAAVAHVSSEAANPSEVISLDDAIKAEMGVLTTQYYGYAKKALNPNNIEASAAASIDPNTFINSFNKEAGINQSAQAGEDASHNAGDKIGKFVDRVKGVLDTNKGKYVASGGAAAVGLNLLASSENDGKRNPLKAFVGVAVLAAGAVYALQTKRGQSFKDILPHKGQAQTGQAI